MLSAPPVKPLQGIFEFSNVYRDPINMSFSSKSSFCVLSIATWALLMFTGPCSAATVTSPPLVTPAPVVPTPAPYLYEAFNTASGADDNPYSGRCAEVRSMTYTTITRPQWVPQTLITLINSYDITTLSPIGPTPTSYPATVVVTVVWSLTAEYQMTFSDGHSSTSFGEMVPITYSTTTVKETPERTPCHTLD